MRLVERDTEKRALREALDSVLEGQGRLIILSGPVGCGKTSLLTDLGGYAEENGCRVVQATAAFSERELPLGVVGQIFDGLRDRAVEARRALDLLIQDPRVGRTRPGFDLYDPPSPDVLRTIWMALLSSSVREPLVVLVDDVQHIDGVSLHFLLYLARRLWSTRVLLVLADSETTPEVSGALRSELTPLPGCVRLPVEPLTVEGVAAVLADNGAPGDRAFAERSHELTGGSASLVVALAGDCASKEAEICPVPGEAFNLAVLSIVRRCGDRPMRVAQQAAVLGEGTTAEWIILCIESDRSETIRAIETLTAAGLFIDGQFRDNSMRVAILRDMDDDSRSEFNLRAGKTLYHGGLPAIEVATYLVACGRGEPWMVPILEEAVEQALESNRDQDAASFLRLARDSCADERQRAAIVAKVMQLEWHSDPRSADRHLPWLHDAHRDGPFRPGTVTRMLGSLLWTGNFETARQLLRAQAQDAYDAEDVAGLRISYYRSQHTYPTIREALGEPPAMSARHISPEESAAEIFAATITQGGNASLADRAEQILSTTPVGDRTMDIIQSLLMTLVYCGQTERARIWCDHVRADERLSAAWRATAETIRAEIALREGQAKHAYAHAQSGLELIGPQQWGVAHAAPIGCIVLACTASGLHDEAEVLLHRPVLQAAFQTRYGLHYLHARGHHNLAVGALTRALTDFRTCGRLMAEWSMDNAALVPWRSDAALVHLQRGETAPARALAKAHLERFPGDIVAEQILECVTEGEAGGIVRAPSVLHPACGGEPHTSVVSSDQRKIASRLTRAELRVARLVVGGLTNREIAANLSLTSSTVEQHLTSILRKLGVRSRKQVSAYLSHLSAAEADLSTSAAEFSASAGVTGMSLRRSGPVIAVVVTAITIISEYNLESNTPIRRPIARITNSVRPRVFISMLRMVECCHRMCTDLAQISVPTDLPPIAISMINARSRRSEMLRSVRLMLSPAIIK